MLKRFKVQKNLSMKNLLECCSENGKTLHSEKNMTTGVEAPPMAHHAAAPYLLVDAREKSRTIFATTLLRIFSIKKSSKEKLNIRHQKADASSKVRTFFFVLFLSVILEQCYDIFICNCISENLNICMTK